MLKKTISYTDYNGIKRTEDHYFDLSKSELIDMSMGTTVGLDTTLNKMLAENDMPMLYKTFKELILKAYGIKSDDGKRFEKSEDISIAFSQTRAYDVLFMELITNEETSEKFIQGIIPSDMVEEVKDKLYLEKNKMTSAIE